RDKLVTGVQTCALPIYGKSYTAKPFKIKVLNVLGAGDAYASGFLYGHLQGWDWAKAARMGNATGAIVVTRQGCANDMATLQETRSEERRVGKEGRARGA